MKKFKVLKFLWLLGIYIILGIILYLVVTYKVSWENKDLNTYLYFYQCDNILCTSTTKQYDYYSKLLCENETCPYVTKIFNDYVILNDNDKTYIYNYKEKISHNTYQNYHYLNDKTFIIVDRNNQYGIYDLNDNQNIIEPSYNYIKDYLNGYVVYKENGLYGIENKELSLNIIPKYEDLYLVDNDTFIGRVDNSYYSYLYSMSEEPITEKYSYAYAYNGYIVTLNNNKLDILNSKLESVLLMKLDTTYTYETESERASLHLSHDNNNIYFTIDNDGIKTSYIFDTVNNKLL